MTLTDFLTQNSLTPSEFARRVGTSRQNVCRWMASNIPRPDEMRRIVAATEGAVTPNDFFGLPPPQAAPQPHPQAEV